MSINEDAIHMTTRREMLIGSACVVAAAMMPQLASAQQPQSFASQLSQRSKHHEHRDN